MTPFLERNKSKKCTKEHKCTGQKEYPTSNIEVEVTTDTIRTTREVYPGSSGNTNLDRRVFESKIVCYERRFSDKEEQA
jgi:hypothetical protein